MITHFKRRILASAVTRMAVLHPAAGHSAPAAPVAAAATADTTQMDHISVQATGSGAPVILIPGLASPRAVYDGIVPAIEGPHRVSTVPVNGRSDARRVGKEGVSRCRSRVWPTHYKKQTKKI